MMLVLTLQRAITRTSFTSEKLKRFNLILQMLEAKDCNRFRKFCEFI